MSNKIFILDTSVILHNYNILKQQRISVIPQCTLDDLEQFQEALGDVGDNARNARYWLSKKLQSIQHGNEIIDYNRKIIFWKDNEKRKHDDKILYTAKEVREKFPNDEIVIITKSIGLRAKAKSNNFTSEDYDDVGLVQQIDGWKNYELTTEEMQMIMKNRQSDTFSLQLKQNLAVNEYIQCTFNNERCPGMIYRYLGNNEFKKIDLKPHMASIVPRSPQQIMLSDALLNKDCPLVSAIGSAGTGKTLLAISAAIQQVLVKHEYNKIIITRPIMPIGKDLGYLPGDVNDKMAEWVRPFMNNIEFIKQLNSIKGKNKVSLQKVGILLDPQKRKGVMEILPITYIRGSSINNAYIIVDQAQNATPSEMKTIITRVGEGSKLVLTGDINQIDNRFLSRQCNGLTMAIKKFWNHQLYSHITLKNVQRSKLSELATKILF